ncbi:MAG: response regulator [candidate division Zixibacteria bacterium]|nr:response regulator [candidate division Zixibacteria bacterium]
MDSKLKILVVDDDAYLLDLMIETLDTIGYDAKGASSGAEALDLIEKSRFQLVITDIKMPKMDGIEFARSVKSKHPDLPIIFISGAFTPSILRKIEGEPYIPKPFRISQMEKVIGEVTTASRNATGNSTGDTILVVDDDDSFRLMLIESLKVSGYKVTGVSNAASAIERTKKGDISAIVTDVRMPGMDGISLSKYIRLHWPELPVILVTAYLNFDESPEMKRLDADGFLMKPFKIESITSLLEKIKTTETVES